MARRKMYTFSERRQSRQGVTSTILGSISLLLFFILAYAAYWMSVSYTHLTLPTKLEV